MKTLPKNPKISMIAARNCRSWEDLNLNLSPGLTVIIGDSDSGKTNIIRNINSILKNDSRKSLTTHGTDEDAFVQVCFQEANAFGNFLPEWVVELSKGEKINSYCTFRVVYNQSSYEEQPEHDFIDKSEYDSVGSSVPDEISKVLRIGPVDLGGESVDFNVANQRGGLFGVDDTPARFAKIIGAVSGISTVFSAIKSGNSTCREIRSKMKHEKVTRDELVEKIEQSETSWNVAVTQENIETASCKVEKIEAIQSDIQKQEGWRDRYRKGVEKGTRYRKIANVNTDNLSRSLGKLKVSEDKLHQMIDWMKRRVSQHHLINTTAEEIEHMKKNLKDVQQELSEFESCPLCGGEI